MTACAVPGCDDPAKAKGLCWRHFGRMRRNGDPLARGKHGGHTEPAPTAPPDPAPLRALRRELQRRRAEGASFASAWAATIVRPCPTRCGPSGPPCWRRRGRRGGSAYDRLPAARAFPSDTLDDAEPWQVHHRSAPGLTTTGARHDGEGTLEPLVVPWCS